METSMQGYERWKTHTPVFLRCFRVSTDFFGLSCRLEGRILRIEDRAETQTASHSVCRHLIKFPNDAFVQRHGLPANGR